MMEDLKYKESYQKCKCGSKIFFNANLPGKVPELCNKCQEIANMTQTKLHHFNNEQKKIHHFSGDM